MPAPVASAQLPAPASAARRREREQIQACSARRRGAGSSRPVARGHPHHGEVIRIRPRCAGTAVCPRWYLRNVDGRPRIIGIAIPSPSTPASQLMKSVRDGNRCQASSATASAARPRVVSSALARQGKGAKASHRHRRAEARPRISGGCCRWLLTPSLHQPHGDASTLAGRGRNAIALPLAETKSVACGVQWRGWNGFGDKREKDARRSRIPAKHIIAALCSV